MKNYTIDIPGAVLGLAYTAFGGTTLYIEATSVQSKAPDFRLTGQLGKVMQKSAQIAYSYIRATSDNDVKMKTFFNENLIHLHVPAGATPKDGPWAGITMALALYSLASAKPVRNDIAMTGELTLTGKVLPIGGVREKTIAARRVKIQEIVLPKENEKDFAEFPDYIREGISVNYVNYFQDVLKLAFNISS